MAKRFLRCACCGGNAGHWQQWENQDTGWGVCATCVDDMVGGRLGRHPVTTEEVRAWDGRAGVHRAPSSNEVAENAL